MVDIVDTFGDSLTGSEVTYITVTVTESVEKSINKEDKRVLLFNNTKVRIRLKYI